MKPDRPPTLHVVMNDAEDSGIALPARAKWNRALPEPVMVAIQAKLTGLPATLDQAKVQGQSATCSIWPYALHRNRNSVVASTEQASLAIQGWAKARTRRCVDEGAAPVSCCGRDAWGAPWVRADPLDVTDKSCWPVVALPRRRSDGSRPFARRSAPACGSWSTPTINNRSYAVRA